MALSEDDYLAILAIVERMFQQYEPDIAIALARAQRKPDDTPRTLALTYLRRGIGLLRERSGSSYRAVLNRLSQHIGTPSGEPMSSIVVDLDPIEQKRYGARVYELSNLPDKNLLIHDLEDILDSLEQEPQ